MKKILFPLLRGLKQAQYWLIAKVVLALLALLRLLPADAALNFADRTARTIGPWVGRHRVAMDNLRKAYPDKPDAELETIARDMWGNMARLAVEYIFIDRLFDFDPQDPQVGRVEVNGIDIFVRLREERKPHIFFTGHLGNFEFLPIGAAAFDLQVSALFRPPNNPYLAEQLFSARRATMGELLASKAGVAFALARILERGGNIGVLVDQKFHRGVQTTFFGRECETSPLVPKLARQYECDVYPARCIRLPGNRFRLDIFERLDLPRAPDGRVDVAATAQLLNDTVEGWVREDPGQWMWFHKRWKIVGR
ncbi:MAG: lipid A biosynthesis lauroyl acyltransferase [Rhizobiaceae bacterium]|nr:lipid A biosynthesis lauroyl acyltransferase [Rhizobiaceae bacterium]MCV0408799.1 lipid A biosynthesis lauroyl acyltransferase [Rhizobiaceae bacterium]